MIISQKSNNVVVMRMTRHQAEFLSYCVALWYDTEPGKETPHERYVEFAEVFMMMVAELKPEEIVNLPTTSRDFLKSQYPEWFLP